MYNVSTEFKNKIKQNSRRIAGKLLLGNLELTPEDIISMNMEYSLGNDGIPAIGGVVASKLEVKLFRDKLPPVLTTQELKPYLGIEVSPGVIEYVPMGVFRISPKDTKKTDKTISLVGYDILFILENSPYNSKLKFPNTLNNIKTELETKGLKFASQALTNVTIKEKPKTIRELLSDISELLGMNVITNKLGEIEFRQLNVVEFDLDANNYYDFKLLADDDVKLTRLTVEKEGEENKDLTYGDDTGYTIKIKNDSITTQNELIAVYNRVFPLSYTAYECDIQGMPHAEVGDIINLTDRHGNKRSIPIAYHRISYSGGLRSEIRANAPSGAISSTGSTGSNSITQSLNDLRVNILEVNTVLADKVSTNELDANVARIEKIINTNLESINAKIKIIETEDLTAINAHITFLKNDVAEINHLLAGNITAENIAVGAITAGSGIIADGAIGDAQISSLSASKLSAGIIDAAIITVKNLNADNITVGTINGQRIADGAIDNSKVAEGANIAGSKLDINDVIININGAETQIDGTKIQVGDRTLDVELSTQKLAIDENSQEISNQKSEINALDDAIKLKVDNQTFNQYKTANDSNITTINTQLSKNTASIDILQKEIALKISQTDVEKLISEIEIGGRNYILNSSFDNGLENWDNWGIANREIITDAKGKNWVHIWQDDEKSWRGIGQRVDAFEKNTDYTISFTAYKIKGNVIILLHQYGEDGNNPQPQANFEITEAPERYIFTFRSADTDKVDFNFMIGGTAKQPFDIYITDIKFEKGTKATDWTPAPEDFESEITAINTKVAGIDITLDDITSRVSSTESNIIKVNDEVSAIESRVSSAEQKITDSAIVSTVRNSTAYINDLNNKANQEDLNLATNKITTLEQTSENFKISINKYENGKLKGTYYDFTGESAIFKGAGFVILNNNYTSVLQGDTEGNLSITGDFVAYKNAQKAIEMKNNSIFMYDWEGTTRTDSVGVIFSARRIKNGVTTSIPGCVIANRANSYLSLSYQNASGKYTDYILFDKDSATGIGYRFPIWISENALFNSGNILGFKSNTTQTVNEIYAGTSGKLVFNLDMTKKDYGFQIQSKTAKGLFGIYAGYDYPIQCHQHTAINGDFTVTGSKNSLQQTENYGDRLINAYETTEYYFGDIGSGFIGEDGLCYIHIDEILQECINSAIQYHVFLQKCGKGEAWVKERHPNYFVVEGTPALEFSWELKAKRRGYEHHRLECPFSSTFIDNSDINNELTKKDEKREELEAIFDKELECDLSKKLLTGGWEE